MLQYLDILSLLHIQHTVSLLLSNTVFIKCQFWLWFQPTWSRQYLYFELIRESHTMHHQGDSKPLNWNKYSDYLDWLIIIIIISISISISSSSIIIIIMIITIIIIIIYLFIHFLFIIIYLFYYYYYYLLFLLPNTCKSPRHQIKSGS
jgi:hypothetical protein